MTTDPYDFARDPQNIPDDNLQFLDVDRLAEREYWHKLDGWSQDMACKVITLGVPLSLKMEEEILRTEHPRAGDVQGLSAEEYGERRRAAQIAFLRFSSMKRVLFHIERLATAAIAVGRLRDPDTPQNWILWARSKGYETNHLDDLLAESEVPKVMPDATQPKQQTPIFPKLEDFRWERLTWTFLPNDQVRITYTGVRLARSTCSFEDLGFRNRKSRDGVPDRLWNFFKIACISNEFDVSLGNQNLDQQARDNLKHTISGIRLRLRKFFQTEDDPFMPHKRGIGWEPKFIIRNESEA